MRVLTTLAPIACAIAVTVALPSRLAEWVRAAQIGLGPKDDHVICRLYLDPHDAFTRVGPPQWQAAPPSTTPALEASATTATIAVNYTGFSSFPAAQAAFQAAVDIWATEVSSSVPIVVNATFSDLGGSGGSGILLGQAGPVSISANFAGNTRANTWFPGPIANALSGIDRNGPTEEIDAQFNNNAAVGWYFGTDGLTPSGKVDFETVVLHELGHGLGFIGSAQYSAGVGSIGQTPSGGSTPFPFIYDANVVDGAGISILDSGTYPNPSTALGSLLTSNNLFWDGSQAKGWNSGVRPKLHAPATFSQGSTYSHLDEATYPPGTPNSLMTPVLNTMESIHAPGRIMLGMFTDMGWTVAPCPYSLTVNTASFPSSGGTSSVGLLTEAGCPWTAATTDPSIANITSATSGVGSAVITYSVAANSAVGPRSGTLIIGGQTLTIRENGTGPLMTLDRASLFFAGVNNGTAFTSQTGSQAVRMTQTGVGLVTWTASSNQPWLIVSPTSGSGTGTFTVSTQWVPGLAAGQGGLITITLSGAGNTVGPINVTLNSIPLGTSAPPTGAFDTPTNGSTGLAGSVPVTGWAIDDVQVTRVTICRDAVSPETAPVDSNCADNAKIFVGDGTFVDGARPDIQAAFPFRPLNTRGGWGYLMLTNGLPNTGNGTFTLYAYAFDADAHTALLGAKTITCDNAHSTAPFGAIDTPGQGATINGSVANFGWVLSPSPNFADPPDGGTVTVFVDSAPKGSPGGWTDRPDLTASFPADKYPGVGKAEGVFGLDTTTLSNGVHTIAWSVTDNVGTTSGVGSRFITVSNGSLMLDPSQTQAAPSNVIVGPATLDMPRAAALRTQAGLTLLSEVDDAPGDFATVQGRRGYDLNQPLRDYTSVDGRIDVQSEELDRIELHLSPTSGHRYAGYLRTPSGLAPLPIGSSLDASTGTFAWMPGVGFYGRYDLVFVRWSGGHAVARQDVRIVLNAKGSNRVGPQTIVDVPGVGRVFRPGEPFIVAGWAADLDSTTGSGVAAVHVWAYPVNDKGTWDAPEFLGGADYGNARPDVAAVYGDRLLNSGYGLIVRGLAPGTYDVAVFAYSTVIGNFAPAKLVRVTVR
jgi:hypothetical protein